MTLRQTEDMETSDFTYHLLLLFSSFASNGVVEDGHFKVI
jgi:hypothetical protein